MWLWQLLLWFVKIFRLGPRRSRRLCLFLKVTWPIARFKSIVLWNSEVNWVMQNMPAIMCESPKNLCRNNVFVTESREWVGCCKLQILILSYMLNHDDKLFYDFYCFKKSKNWPYLSNQMSDWHEVYIKIKLFKCTTTSYHAIKFKYCRQVSLDCVTFTLSKNCLKLLISRVVQNVIFKHLRGIPS